MKVALGMETAKDAVKVYQIESVVTVKLHFDTSRLTATKQNHFHKLEMRVPPDSQEHS